MTRWPLLLPPPAVSTSPSRSRRSSSSIVVKSPSCHTRRQVVVAPSIAIAPRRPSPSIRHRAVHRRPSPLCSQSIAAALALSLAVEEPARAVSLRRGAVVLSLTVEEPSRRPSPSRSRHVIHCRRGAVTPYLTIKELSAVSTDDSGHSSRPSKPLVVRLVVALPLLMPPPPICRCLSLQPSPFVPLVRPASCPVSSLLTPPPPISQHLCLSLRHCLLLSRPSRASCLAG